MSFKINYKCLIYALYDAYKDYLTVQPMEPNIINCVNKILIYKLLNMCIA